MSQYFKAVPLFDSYRPFFALKRSTLFPGDIPTVKTFVDSIADGPVPEAADDYWHTKDFLWSKCRRSEATYNAFRSESERFLLWAWCIHGKSIGLMKKRDIEAYIDFVVTPPKSWIAARVCRRFESKDGQKQPNKNWRPFVVKLSKAERKELMRSTPGTAIKPDSGNYALAQKSLREVFSNLSVLYNHLVEEDYAFGNAIAAVKKASPHLIVDVSNDSVKRLSALQWEYVLESTRTKADQDPVWERHLFIIAAMKSLYLRVSELSCRPNWNPKMGDFYREENDWWFIVFGKGNKKRKVSVPVDFLDYLRRYRLSRGLDGLPAVGESSPLLHTMRKYNPGLRARTIAMLAQEAFDLASDNMAQDGFEDDAKVLLATSTHWLRHTGASMDVDSRALKDLSADLGHGKLSTTDKEYVHADDKERAASGRMRRV
ncbi:site-specific integrase [Microbulbifer sp. 2205BS26-8]|uniref:tyrosine-type recombinase/integrase n=1 Tax=Microbulbifer sp. 2205BS26-8 TaxID=3064386 RepID=UPI0027402B0B|nr:site-specific integrase [Microbulbifer sp. 2205BS26-8]MDP5210197.1 site-specific integrase [Microbulbifer sp. 2205BS26-8]